MDFEYDENKSRANKIKHGIDFDQAQELWNDPDRIEIPVKYLDEPRYVLIAVIKNKHWSAIFTYRHNKIRLISVRRARKYEEEIYKS
ncbi:BrnT family toxin [candidate division KSB1 bacterium]|nr:BrnT family toxin [candidate division KSB1 bacterium]